MLIDGANEKSSLMNLGELVSRGQQSTPKKWRFYYQKISGGWVWGKKQIPYIHWFFFFWSCCYASALNTPHPSISMLVNLSLIETQNKLTPIPKASNISKLFFTGSLLSFRVWTSRCFSELTAHYNREPLLPGLLFSSLGKSYFSTQRLPSA